MERQEQEEPFSVAVPVTDPDAVSAIVSAARAEPAKSVRLELRGSPKDIMSALSGLRDTSAISASLSIRKT